MAACICWQTQGCAGESTLSTTKSTVVPIAEHMNFTEAFLSYGAKLANAQWAYSAEAPDGSIVLSCWAHRLKYSQGTLIYRDYMSRWNVNAPGKNLLKQHLSQAFEKKLAVRLVIATTNRPEVIDRGETATGLENSFHAKPEAIGRVTAYDGENFEVVFAKSGA